MQKTRLGISVGLLGAAIYLTALFGGYIPLILLVGYTLLCEENAWLKKSAVKAAVIVFAFALLSALIGFIPNAIGLINDIAGVFKESFSIAIVSKILTVVNTVLVIAEKIILIVLGIKAFTQGGISIGFIDKVVGKHMD